jgi:hypothetical protein
MQRAEDILCTRAYVYVQARAGGDASVRSHWLVLDLPQSSVRMHAQHTTQQQHLSATLTACTHDTAAAFECNSHCMHTRP